MLRVAAIQENNRAYQLGQRQNPLPEESGSGSERTWEALKMAHPAAVRFKSGQSGTLPAGLLWISGEGIPYTGGLGMVTRYAPAALNEALGADARIIQAFVKGTDTAE